MNLLGISAHYHDSAAALIRDGEIVAAAQEERFTRKKHDPGFPENAVRYCLKEAGLEIADLDGMVYYDKPLIKFERLLGLTSPMPHAVSNPSSWQCRSGSGKALPEDRAEEQRDRRLQAELPRLMFAEHHQSHAASAFIRAR